MARPPRGNYESTDGDRFGGRLFDGDGQGGRGAQPRPARVLHALGPDVEAALPRDAQVVRDIPDAPDAFAFVVAGVEDVVLADVVLDPTALAVGQVVPALDGERPDGVAAAAGHDA